jgi:hypothetical protein
VEHLEAVRGTVELDGFVEVETGDTDVVDSSQHGSSAPLARVVTQRARHHTVRPVTARLPLSTLAAPSYNHR